MPGMMDTILNLGLNDETVEGLARRGEEPALRLGLLPALRRDVRRRRARPEALDKRERDPFEVILEAKKTKAGVKLDTELHGRDLQELVRRVQGRDP